MPEPIACNDGRSLAVLLKKLLPGTETLCEPFFGGPSIVFYPADFHFKVKILNDTSRGLVHLFELHRLDPGFLKSFLKKHETGRKFNFKCLDTDFLNSSPFLNEMQDIKDGLDVIVFLRELLNDIHQSGSKDFITYIHGLLKIVLIENLPPIQCLERFDRDYTVSFLPRMSMQSLDPEAFGEFLAGMEGKLLTDYIEDDDMLLTRFKNKFTIDITFEGNPVGRSLVCLEPL